jgi:hypothetical protein
LARICFTLKHGTFMQFCSFLPSNNPRLRPACLWSFPESSGNSVTFHLHGIDQRRVSPCDWKWNSSSLFYFWWYWGLYSGPHTC